MKSGLVFLCFAALATTLHSAEPDYRAWNSLLRKYVHSGSREGITTALVRYAALSKDPLWQAAQDSVSTFDTTRLSTPAERMAFWINVYNIAAVRKVLEIYPTTSITARGEAVWKAPAITITKHNYSLDAIEHEILRPLGDARIHFAIVCASLSCPDLRREAYTAVKLQQQLNAQTRSFLSNPSKGIQIQRESVRLSAIFSWFAQDFGDLEKFVARYGVALPKGIPKAEIPYNWKLNE